MRFDIVTKAAEFVLPAIALLALMPQHPSIDLTMRAPEREPLGQTLMHSVWDDVETVRLGITGTQPLDTYRGHTGCYLFTYIVGPDAIGCGDGFAAVITEVGS